VRARICWILAGATLVLVVADIAVTAQYQHLLSEAAVAVHGFPFVEGAVLGSAVMGALIVSDNDRHPIGWLLSSIGFLSAIALLAESYGIWVTEEGGPGSQTVGGAAFWLSILLGGQLAIAGLSVMFLLAPDGRLLSPRWRYAVWATALGALTCTAGVLSVNPTTTRPDTQSASGQAPTLDVLFTLGLLVVSGGLIASLVSMVLRWWRSRGEARRQVRLIALSVVLLTVSLVWLIVVQTVNGGEQTWLGGVPLFVAYFLLPILFAVAVLRYRLYDIDVIINRAVLLTTATAFAAVGYTTLVVLVGSQVQTQAGNFTLSLIATTIVALAFQPLRHGVVRLANRLAYGSRARPYEALSDFSRRLADTPSPAALLPAVAEAAGRAVSARGATATLNVDADPELVTATWGAGPDGTTISRRVPVQHDGATLGEIVVSVPRGRELRPTDIRLLQALADQAAVAFRNISMELQLGARVAELERTTLETARSRTRIVEADDAARRRLEGAISNRVLPQLVSVAGDLGDARTEVPVGATRIDGMIADVNAALEALRDLTRGVFPTQLAKAGLEPALRSMLARSSKGTSLTVHPRASRRFDARVEAAVYYSSAEAARAGATSIALTVEETSLLQQVTGVTPSALDFQAISDRVEAAGGGVGFEQDTLVLSLPVEPELGAAG
jgi:signal transduction histidine kinase